MQVLKIRTIYPSKLHYLNRIPTSIQIHFYNFIWYYLPYASTSYLHDYYISSSPVYIIIFALDQPSMTTLYTFSFVLLLKTILQFDCYKISIFLWQFICSKYYIAHPANNDVCVCVCFVTFEGLTPFGDCFFFLSFFMICAKVRLCILRT